ncbi:AAA family ATPase [Marinitoga arctica]
MGRYLYLTKAVIKNFRAIKNVTLKNTGDINVLVGANESGKSNILLSLNWLGNDTPLSLEDKPLGRNIKDDDIIVTAFFKVTNVKQFKKEFFDLINENMEYLFLDESILNFNKLNDIGFLKIIKHANGDFNFLLLGKDLKDLSKDILNYLSKDLRKFITLIPSFEKLFIENIKTTLKSNNIISGDLTKINKDIKNLIKTNQNISTHLNSFNGQLEIVEKEIKESNDDIITLLTKRINPLFNNIPTNISININNKSTNINLHSIFSQTLNKLIGNVKKNNYKSLLQDILSYMKPKFVYLSEEMELKGEIKKTNSFENTLKEENGNYPVNARLFSILEIDLSTFDKMTVDEQIFDLNNKLIEFSKGLKDLWQQLRLKIGCNVERDRITLKIEEVGKDGYDVRTTPPSARSRGFKWYLAYLITLEYLAA